MGKARYVISGIRLKDITVDSQFDRGCPADDARVTIRGVASIDRLPLRAGRGCGFLDFAEVETTVFGAVPVADDGTVDISDLKAKAIAQLRSLAESYGDHEEAA